MKSSKKILITLFISILLLFTFWGNDIKFIVSFISNPSSTGAIKPSSNQLAKYMVEQVPPDAVVLELGAGTGPFTEELNKKIPRENLYIVENNPEFYKVLKRKFPQHNLLLLDAQELHLKLPKSAIGRITHIVSGLPFRSLPKEVADNIIKSLQKVVRSDAIMVQFTYFPQKPLSKLHEATLRVKGKFYKSALINIPPAHVWIYKPIKQKKSS